MKQPLSSQALTCFVFNSVFPVQQIIEKGQDFVLIFEISQTKKKFVTIFRLFKFIHIILASDPLIYYILVYNYYSCLTKGLFYYILG